MINHDQESIRARAEARAEIEGAIATLQARKAALTEGQVKAIKRIIYWNPQP